MVVISYKGSRGGRYQLSQEGGGGGGGGGRKKMKDMIGVKRGGGGGGRGRGRGNQGRRDT